MARMGHDDMRAALIYQQATSDADEQIADRLSDLVDEQRTDGDGDDPTTARPGHRFRCASGPCVAREAP